MVLVKIIKEKNEYKFKICNPCEKCEHIINKYKLFRLDIYYNLKIEKKNLTNIFSS